MTIEDEPLTVDYLVMEFPGDTITGAGLALLADLVDGGVGRVVDLVFIRKDLFGSTSVIEVAELSQAVQLDVAALSGLHTGRLNHLDIAAAGAHIDTGSSAGVIVFETSSETSEPALVARPAVRRRPRPPR
jgi:uncharacterized protein DUF6325